MDGGWWIVSTSWLLTRGASTVKYTTLLPYIGLIESDPKIYINFEICEGKKYINN